MPHRNDPDLIPIEEWLKAKSIEIEYYHADKPCRVETLFSGMFSNIKKHYLAHFPEKTFKTIRVKTQHETMSDFRKFMKGIPQNKERPIIVFDPTDEFNIVEDTIFSDVHGLNIPISGENRIGGLNLYNKAFMDFGKYFDDPTILGLTYKLNRFRNTVGILIVVSSVAEQMNMYNYMITHIRHKGKYTLQIPTTFVLEKVYMLNIAKIFKIDPKSKAFVDRINQCSLYPVRIINYANGDWDYYITMPTEYYIDIPNLPDMKLYERKNMVEDVVMIRSTIVAEADLPSSIQFVVSKKILTAPIKSEELTPSPVVTFMSEHENIKIPRIYNGYLNMDFNDIVFEEDKKTAEIPYDAILRIDKDIYDYCMEKKNVDDYIDFIVWENYQIKEYIRKDGKLILENVKQGHAYSVASYVNMQKIHDEGNARMRYITGTLIHDGYFVQDHSTLRDKK